MLPLSSSYFSRPERLQVSKNARGFFFISYDIKVASWCIEGRSFNAAMEADGSRTILEDDSSMVGKYQGLFPPQHGEFAQSMCLHYRLCSRRHLIRHISNSLPSNDIELRARVPKLRSR